VSYTDKEKERMSNVPYASAIGSLMYAMLCTRLYICITIGLVSHYQSNLRPAHWQVVKRIFHYLLHGTSDLVLCYQNENLSLRGYSDVDWGDDLDEFRSTSGYVFTIGGGATSWYNRKIRLHSAVNNGSRVCCLLASYSRGDMVEEFSLDLSLIHRVHDPVELMCDNIVAIQFAKDPKFHMKAKHIKRCYHFVQDTIKGNEVASKYISTNKMIADLLLNLFLETLSKLM